MSAPHCLLVPRARPTPFARPQPSGFHGTSRATRSVIAGPSRFGNLSAPRFGREDQTVFYSGSVMLAFEYLHDLNIIYRDLKVTHHILV